MLEKAENPFLLKLLDGGKPVADALIVFASQHETPPSKIELAMMWLAFDNNDSKALAAAMRGFKELFVRNEQLKQIKLPTLTLYSIEGEPAKHLKI